MTRKATGKELAVARDGIVTSLVPRNRRPDWVAVYIEGSVAFEMDAGLAQGAGLRVGALLSAVACRALAFRWQVAQRLEPVVQPRVSHRYRASVGEVPEPCPRVSHTYRSQSVRRVLGLDNESTRAGVYNPLTSGPAPAFAAPPTTFPEKQKAPHTRSFVLMSRVGLEPTTIGLKVRCSTN